MQTTRFTRFMDAYCNAVEKALPFVVICVLIPAVLATGAIPFLLICH